jgi:hypothetical protein
MMPFAAVPKLFLVAGDSDLLRFLQEAHALLAGCPSLIERAEADLDAHGCRKKALRVADAAWRAERTAPLPGYTNDPSVVEPTQLKLKQGRPRTSAYVVLIALLLRGSEVLTPVSSQVDRVAFTSASGCPAGWDEGRAGTGGVDVRP